MTCARLLRRSHGQEAAAELVRQAFSDGPGTGACGHQYVDQLASIEQLVTAHQSSHEDLADRVQAVEQRSARTSSREG